MSRRAAAAVLWLSAGMHVWLSDGRPGMREWLLDRVSNLRYPKLGRCRLNLIYVGWEWPSYIKIIYKGEPS
jgi:hypothetical protein